MKQKLSSSNPFPINAKAHFWEVLHDDGISELHIAFLAHMMAKPLQNWLNQVWSKKQLG